MCKNKKEGNDKMKLKESSKQGFKDQGDQFISCLIFGCNDGMEIIAHVFFIWAPLILGITFMCVGGEVSSIIVGGGVILFLMGLILLVVAIIANVNYHFTNEESEISNVSKEEFDRAKKEFIKAKEIDELNANSQIETVVEFYPNSFGEYEIKTDKGNFGTLFYDGNPDKLKSCRIRKRYYDGLGKISYYYDIVTNNLKF